jgi:hypothetical protein
MSLVYFDRVVLTLPDFGRCVHPLTTGADARDPGPDLGLRQTHTLQVGPGFNGHSWNLETSDFEHGADLGSNYARGCSAVRHGTWKMPGRFPPKSRTDKRGVFLRGPSGFRWSVSSSAAVREGFYSSSLTPPINQVCVLSFCFRPLAPSSATLPLPATAPSALETLPGAKG